MAMIRKIALGLLLVAAAIAVLVAVTQFSHYNPWDYPPVHAASDLDERARILQDRVEILSRRVGDMELLVLVLLVTSGLYAIVFVASSYFSAKSFARQADRTVNHIKDEIGFAMGDLRELQEQTQRGLDGSNVARGTEEDRPGVREPAAAGVSIPDAWELQVAGMAQRTSHWKDKNLGDHEKLELLRFESEAAYLEIAGGRRLAPAVAGLYRNFSAIYAANDPIRARFYLDRALVLAFPEPQLASEVRYDLACWFAGAHDFEQAMRELATAFQRQSKALDARLATDLEEGGCLYELASTPPFDKRLNDLLLNVSIP
jgi:hypothetical protein